MTWKNSGKAKSVHIIFHGQKLKKLFSKIWNKTRILHSPLLFNITLDILDRAIGQEKELKDWKGESNTGIVCR